MFYLIFLVSDKREAVTDLSKCISHQVLTVYSCYLVVSRRKEDLIFSTFFFLGFLLTVQIAVADDQVHHIVISIHKPKTTQ